MKTLLKCHENPRVTGYAKVNSPNIRSSSPEVFIGKGALKISSNITGERSCQSVISVKLLRQFTCNLHKTLKYFQLTQLECSQAQKCLLCIQLNTNVFNSIQLIYIDKRVLYTGTLSCIKVAHAFRHYRIAFI